MMKYIFAKISTFDSGLLTPGLPVVQTKPNCKQLSEDIFLRYLGIELKEQIVQKNQKINLKFFIFGFKKSAKLKM